MMDEQKDGARIAGPIYLKNITTLQHYNITEGYFWPLSRTMLFFIMGTHVLDKQIDKMLRDKGVPDGMARPVC